MNDLNFFTISKKKNTRTQSGLVFLLVILMLVGAITVYYVMKSTQIRNVESNIQEMETYLDSDEIQSQLIELDQLTEKNKLLQDYYDGFMLVDSNIRNNTQVSSTLMRTVIDVIPVDVVFQNYWISSSEIHIDAMSSDTQAIAEMVYNLKQTDLFTSVLLLDISSQAVQTDVDDPDNPEEQGETDQFFRIQCVLEEGVIQ